MRAVFVIIQHEECAIVGFRLDYCNAVFRDMSGKQETGEPTAHKTDYTTILS